VYDIFYSIQGESSYAGRPCVFVRLAGCNLRCSHCDTQYAYDEGVPMEIDEIINRVDLYQWQLVEITGGEPLLQKETPALICHLLDRGYAVLLETNGSQDIAQVDDRCIKIVDVKCPSSGEEKNNDLGNLFKLSEEDEVKFVIGNREDYKYAKEIMKIMDPKILKASPPHFSPVFEQLEPHALADWILEDHLNVRLHVQLHNFIWHPFNRPV
jgi:7-carboxy-7-deazaguanine synthase